MKAQVLLNQVTVPDRTPSGVDLGETQQIIATAFGKGRTHDFKLFKQSCTHVHPNTMLLADLGYLGLDRLHAHTFLPAKATKHHLLTLEEKQANRTLDDLRAELKMQVEVGGTNLAELARVILSGVGEAHTPQFGFSTHAVKEARRQH